MRCVIEMCNCLGGKREIKPNSIVEYSFDIYYPLNGEG